MKIKMINHSCLQINSGSKIIYFDPYEIPGKSEGADIILASHDHYDHFDEKSVKKIQKDTTTIIGPKSCSKILKHKGTKGLAPGDSISIDGVEIKAVRAYNPNKRFHPKSNDWNGYVVTIDGIKFYHAGDTDLIPEMKDLAEMKIDYAMLPVGDTYTMGFDESIEALGVIKPKNFIPMHTWDKDLTELVENAKAKYPEINVIVLKSGEEKSI